MVPPLLEPCPPEGCALSIESTELIARASGALWMPQSKTLVVSDLHLGKAERNARRGGGLWPPYENEATLTRLESEIAALDPASIVFLGDSFDDGRCVEALAEDDLHRIHALTNERNVTWIAGNHDPYVSGLPGASASSLTVGFLTLRHIGRTNAGRRGEISGHYHPKATIHARARRVRRKCFLADEKRIILPAFGAYTGGLDVFDPVFNPLFGPNASVILTGERAMRAPLSRLRALAA